MKTKLAVAMALVVAGIGAGLGPAPFAAAQSNNCPAVADFTIPGSSQSRMLPGNDDEIGKTTLSSLDSDKTLHVELLSVNDRLEWTVLEEDANDDCVEFTSGDCDLGGSYPNVITTQNTEQTCTLDAPSSGTEDYWVRAENPQSDGLQYSVWVD